MADKVPSGKKTPTSKSQLTPEQRTQQQLLNKIKRLNLKLAKVKQVAVHMEREASTKNMISAHELRNLSKSLLKILNQ